MDPSRTERLTSTVAAADYLRAGHLVAFGTETVYGLGADATNDIAVARIYEAKGRPSFNPLICHFATADAVFAHVVSTPMARMVADAFWPGPLTLVLPRQPDCPIAHLAGAGLPTLAVRVPSHPVAQDLLRLVGRPVAAPSANRSGRVSPTSAAHVLADLDGRITAVLDSGPCIVGLESTVLDLSGERPVLLRPGGITREMIEPLTGPLAVATTPGSAPPAPGMLASHYAPSVPVRLNAQAPHVDEAFLAFGPISTNTPCFQLSAAQNLVEAAARLFEGLHWLDQEAGRNGLRGIAVAPVPMTGLGVAINDRLSRAAAPRG